MLGQQQLTAFVQAAMTENPGQANQVQRLIIYGQFILLQPVLQLERRNRLVDYDPPELTMPRRVELFRMRTVAAKQLLGTGDAALFLAHQIDHLALRQ